MLSHCRFPLAIFFFFLQIWIFLEFLISPNRNTLGHLEDAVSLSSQSGIDPKRKIFSLKISFIAF
jgi:hypothetical protein